MNRSENLLKLKEKTERLWDVVIIGGGASGLGAAVDAASRGYSTLLIEKNDFAKGTSSRSTKLVHGGVRYLQNGDISLVIEALRERGVMRKNAPHLVKNMSFVIPSYDWWNSPFYGLGLKVYDMMAGKLGLGPSTLLNRDETIAYIPNVKKNGLKGGVIYHDGQFDDARMAISLALTATSLGATLINYCETIRLKKEAAMIHGLFVRDHLSGEELEINAKVVINATGVFSDTVIKMDQPQSKNMIRPSQGVHIVLDKSFLKGNHAIMVPHTSDGRVLFAVPWNDHVVVGTTDTPVEDALEEPVAQKQEIEFILSNAGNYMTKKPTQKDIKSIFAGLRPLAATEDNSESTKEVSRHHKIRVSTSGLVSILGGKWTTYRKIAEDAINTAQVVGGLPERKSETETLQIYGYEYNSTWENPMHVYGTEEAKVINQAPETAFQSLSEEFFITKNIIIWGVEQEMAITVEDILARRTRCLFLNAEESIKIAPKVAEIMAAVLGKDKNWQKEEVKKFIQIATNYKI